MIGDSTINKSDLTKQVLNFIEGTKKGEIEAGARTLRVAKALCAAGFHEWPLTDGTGSDYNNRQEQRYWLRLAVAAIQEIEHEP